MDYLTLTAAGTARQVPYPNDFQMQKTPNKVASLTTLSGKTICDINGWKYENTKLKWDTLLETDLQNLLSSISGNEFQLTFTDIDGPQTVNAVLESRINTKTRYKHNGAIVWKDVEVEVSFPDCYQ